MPVMDGVEATRRIMKQSPMSDPGCDRHGQRKLQQSLRVARSWRAGRSEYSGAWPRRRHRRRRRSETQDPQHCPSARCRRISIRRRSSARRASSAASPSRDTAPTAGDWRIHRRTAGAGHGACRTCATAWTIRSSSFNISTNCSYRDWSSGWRMKRSCQCEQIEPGQSPVIGTIGVACTSDHLVLTSAGVFQYVREPAAHAHRPSVDVLFDSLRKGRCAAGRRRVVDGHGTRRRCGHESAEGFRLEDGCPR